MGIIFRHLIWPVIYLYYHCRDFPDFYSKLYQLLQPSVLHVKYLPRFFYLMNLFLSSSWVVLWSFPLPLICSILFLHTLCYSHLPAYLVSAFVKRLSRLSLTAPPSALTILIPFIFNLIKRHPSCSPLVHHPSPPSGKSTLIVRRNIKKDTGHVSMDSLNV